MIDFRSDTVTKPSPNMLNAMLNAKVGDDVFDEDPTVKLLEEKAADLFGMESAIFCASGTMTNQIAIKCFTQPLDEIILDQKSHVYCYEGGGIMYNSNASVKLINGKDGKITADQIKLNINPGGIYYPKSSLVILENTANKAGGVCYTLEEIKPIAKLCYDKNLKLHLDGARIFNALCFTKDSAKEYGKYFNGISICLSKGLGAPIGSLFLSDKQTIDYAKRVRKVMGGGWRQAGFLAAAGIYALDNHIERLTQDHYHASLLHNTLQNLNFVDYVYPVYTNIVLFKTKIHINNQIFVDELQKLGIGCSLMDAETIRFVTHLDISFDDINKAINILSLIEKQF